jgi:hypothetical protein
MSSKLLMIDPENFVLEGEFERLIVPEKTILDEENILAAIDQFKTDFVDPGLAVGELNEGFLIIPTEDGEQVIEEEKEPAFMIIDIYWDRSRRAICGKLILLDTEDGDKVKKEIGQGVECFMSATQTETYTVMDDSNGRMLTRISNIKGYKLSLFKFQNTI